MNFYQIFLPVITTLYITLVFVLRSLIIWQKTGINPIVFTNSDNAHDFVGKAYKAILIVVFIPILLYSFIPEYYRFALPVYYLESEATKAIGVFLIIISFIFTGIAQYQMSDSWRIGINYEEKTKLITEGLFKYSRNPVFLGVLFSYFGVFLVIPNLITFSSFVSLYLAIQVQVRLEEEYMTKQHGNVYLTYKQKVRRWI